MEAHSDTATPDRTATVADGALRPWGRGFVDPLLEAQWRHHSASERVDATRVNIGLLLATTVGFGVLDGRIYPDQEATLHALRALLVGLLLAPAPLVYLPAWRDRFVAGQQEVLAYLTSATLLVLWAMAWVVLDESDPLRLHYTLLAGLFALLCVSFLSGLQVRYAGPAGTFGVLGFLAIAAVRAHLGLGDVLLLVGYLGAELAVSLAAAASLERAERLDFAARRRLDAAHRRSDALLRNLMPAALAARFEAGADTLDRLPSATVLFATLDGFDAVSRERSPVDAVRTLDRIVAQFDQLAQEHGVERIKTVGATYLAAAGVLGPAPDHAVTAARFALALRRALRTLTAAEGLPLRLRIGVATGPLVAGLTGRTRIAFDVWGDTANVAARLDTHGLPDRIQLSAATAEAVRDTLSVTPRGPVAVKGKGVIETYWLDDPKDTP